MKVRSILLPQYNPNLIRALLGVKTDHRLIPPLKSDEVLVKMAYAPINPSDIAFIQGGYNVIKPLPCVPGFEASGEVVESGLDAKDLLGSQVSCFVQSQHDGTWSEYFVAKTRNCIPLKEEMDLQQAATLGINPLTAFGLMEMIKKQKTNAFIQNAATGQLGTFMRKLSEKENISVINLVRKAEQFEELRLKGNQYVLNTTDENFEEELKTMSKELNAGIAIDAVGDELGGKMFNALKKGGKLITYGGLSGKDLSGIKTLDLIFNQKTIEGFNLNDWIEAKSKDELKHITDQIQDLFIEGSFQSQIQSVFPLSEVVSAVRTYIKGMSKGKVLLKAE